MSEHDQVQALEAEIARLKTSKKRLAEEKAYLQLTLRLIERLNPLSGLDAMIVGLLTGIVEMIGGTNISLWYWLGQELHYADFLGERSILTTVTDPMASEVVRERRFIEIQGDDCNSMMRGDVLPGAWTWAFPLLVADELIGIVKLENVHILGASLRNYLPIFLGHAALLLSNEIRNVLRRRAEAELLEKTEELDHYFNSALDLFCIADTDGYFLKATLNKSQPHDRLR